MLIRNTTAGYGLVSRTLHWLMAIAIFGMFGLGLWMVDLDYYSPYYHSAPYAHKAIGMLLLIALLARFIWRLVNANPSSDHLTPFERAASHITHIGFYVLIFALIASGYLMSTADGRAVDVFGWFSVPSPGENKGLEDPAGAAHTYIAYVVIAFAVIHALAALKHHLIDRDSTLTRMWSGPPKI
jgi:cytochrome b561